METLENTNGAVTKTDLRWRGGGVCNYVPLATPLNLYQNTFSDKKNLTLWSCADTHHINNKNSAYAHDNWTGVQSLPCCISYRSLPDALQRSEMTLHTFKGQLKAYLFHVWCSDEQKEHLPLPGDAAFCGNSGAGYKTADFLTYSSNQNQKSLIAIYSPCTSFVTGATAAEAINAFIFVRRTPAS